MCFESGCGAAPAGSDGRCLAHLDDVTLGRLLADAGRSHPVEGRGVKVEPGLLARMLDLAPRDAYDRPLLRSVAFDGARFVGRAAFKGVAFGDASFDGATFSDEVSFDNAVFSGQARFGSVSFAGPAGFARARFEDHAWFSGTSFVGDVTFDDARFAGPAWFGSTAFAADALFRRATFGRDAGFGGARFGCHAAFVDAQFDGDVSVASATFKHPARYDGARFKGPSGAPPGAARQVAWAGAPPAPWPSRAAAALIDLTIPLAVFAVVVGLPVLWGSLGYGLSRTTLVVIAAAVATALTVQNLVAQGESGQSVGKKKLGLSLVRKSDGLPVGAAVSVLRYVLHLADTVPLFVGWLAPLWSTTSQTFSDRLTTTMVVQQRGWSRGPARPSGVPASGFG